MIRSSQCRSSFTASSILWSLALSIWPRCKTANIVLRRLTRSSSNLYTYHSIDLIQGVIDYRIWIRIHTESRFRFSKKCIRITNPNPHSDSVKPACSCKSISIKCLIIEKGSWSVKWSHRHVIKLSKKHTNHNIYWQTTATWLYRQK